MEKNSEEGLPYGRAAKAGEFKTAVVGGFKKADVLAYIEQLTARNQAEKQAQQQAADKLREEVEQLKKDKQLLVDKTREVCDKLAAQEKLTAQETERASGLASQLLSARENADLTRNACVPRSRKRWFCGLICRICSSCWPAVSRRWSRPVRLWKMKSRHVPVSWISSRKASPPKSREQAAQLMKNVEERGRSLDLRFQELEEKKLAQRQQLAAERQRQRDYDRAEQARLAESSRHVAEASGSCASSWPRWMPRLTRQPNSCSRQPAVLRCTGGDPAESGSAGKSGSPLSPACRGA